MKSILMTLFVLLSFSTNILAEDEEYKELSKEYPLHFLGSLPGENCKMNYQIDLFQNRTFFLREECFKDGVSNGAHDDIGRWYVDNDNRVVLNGTKTKVRYFSVIDENSIALMDLKGNKIDSKLNNSLKLSTTVKSLEPRLRLVGSYSHMADAGIFYECSTGLSFPVALQEDNEALEKSYSASITTPNQALKTELDARISQRKEQNRSSTKATIMVEKFIKIIPKEKCQNPYSKAKLKGTYWKLTQLNSRPLSLSKNRREEANMTLLENGKIKGNSGCNNFHGVYELEANKLVIPKPMAMTRMFCKNSTEREFIKALKDMNTYKIKSEYLEIFDKDGTNLARFESVYLY